MIWSEFKQTAVDPCRTNVLPLSYATYVRAWSVSDTSSTVGHLLGSYFDKKANSTVSFVLALTLCAVLP